MSTGEKVQSALEVHKLTFWEAAMIIVGANIGSGILGLAYSIRKSGWPILMIWLLIAGFFTTISMLYVAETTLRTKKPMQLPGLAKRYVGEVGSWLVLYLLPLMRLVVLSPTQMAVDAFFLN